MGQEWGSFLIALMWTKQADGEGVFQEAYPYGVALDYVDKFALVQVGLFP